MPGTCITVSLSEVLEVSGQPLREIEIWSVLYHSGIWLAQNLSQGNVDHYDVSSFLVTPDSLCFRSDGSVVICMRSSYEGSQYMAVELYSCPVLSVDVIEKSFIFSLGKTLTEAAQNGLHVNQFSEISRGLESVLQGMIEKDSSFRMDSSQLIQACVIYQEKENIKEDFSLFTQQLYNMVMGNRSSSDEENVMWSSRQSNGGHYASHQREIRAKRSRQRKRNARKGETRQRSRSRSRGRNDREDDYENQVEESDQSGLQHKPRLPSYTRHMQSMASTSVPGLSYHLSDITSHTMNHSYHSLPHSMSDRNSSFDTGSYMAQTAYEKYVRLKERQKKLKVLRQELLGDEPDVSGVMDHLREGSLQRRIGSELGLRYDADKESTGSSDISQRLPQRLLENSAPSLHSMSLSEKLKEARSQRSNCHSSKEFYGPEFVHKSSLPIMSIPVPLQGESVKNISAARRVVVVLLTGQKLEALVDPSTTGHQMFEAIITHIELPEFFFFGLTYFNNNEHFFLEPETKLHKISPEGWKEGWKSGMPAVTLTLYLRVKYYPDDLSTIRHQVTRHLLYLQLRHDLLEEHLRCNEETFLQLTGLALQAEYGNYDSNMGDNYFIPDHYFPDKVLQSERRTENLKKAVRCHESFTLLTERQAQMEFIKEAMTLQEYGTHFYKMFKSKGDTSRFIWLGICLKCMVLGENHSMGRITTQQYPWHAIQKISFNKRRFSISIKPDFGQGRPPKMNYYTNSFRKGSYLLQFLTSQHRFQLSLRARESHHAAMGQRSEPSSEPDDSILDISEVKQGQGEMPKEHISSNSPPVYRQPPSYSASVSMLDLHAKYALPASKLRSNQIQHAATTGDIPHEVQTDSEKHAYILGMSTHPTLPQDGIGTNETMSASFAQRLSYLSPDPHQSSTFEVVLEKEAGGGIGVTIVGGESEFGIFIKEVRSHGPADIDQRIRRGDRLLAINDTNLDRKDHQAAVNMIKQSGNKVKLLISRINLSNSLPNMQGVDAIVPSCGRQDSDATDVSDYILPDSDYECFIEKSKDEKKILSESSQSSYLSSSHIHSFGSSQGEESSRSTYNDVQRSFQSPEEKCAHHEEIVSSSVQSEDPTKQSTLNHEQSSLPAQTQKMEKLSFSEEREDQPTSVFKRVSSASSDLQKEDEGKQKLEEETLEFNSNTFMDKDRSNCNNIRESLKEDFNDESVYHVDLVKKDGTFGLNIAGGINTSVRQGGIYIKSFQKYGAAEEQGIISVGDRILEINGKSLSNFTHKQAVEVIRGAPMSCHFVMQHSKSESEQNVLPKSAAERTDVTSELKTDQQSFESTVELMESNSVMTFDKTGSLEKPNVSSVSSCHTTQTNGTMTGAKHGIEGDSPLNHTGQVPDDDGCITTEGDGCITTEDDSCITTEDDGSVTSKVDKHGCVYYPFVNEDNTYSVELKKGLSGFGFSVYGGIDVDTDQPTQGIVRIKQVFPIGPASSSGIQQDDVLLEVNGKPVKGLTHAETISTLRSATSNVNLLMCRPDVKDLSPLFKQQPGPQSISVVTCPQSQYQSETESEDEPVLYRDSLTERDIMITPPTGFSSPTQHTTQFDLPFVPPPSSPPPPLPRSLPPTSPQCLPLSPTLSLHSEPTRYVMEEHHMTHWSNMIDPRQSFSPRSGYDGDMNSTLESLTDEEEERENQGKVRLLGQRMMNLSRNNQHSDNSHSDDSDSSASSIIKSPLKYMHGSCESNSMIASNNSDSLTLGEDMEGLNQWDVHCPEDFIEPTAPRGSPSIDSGWTSDHGDNRDPYEIQKCIQNHDKASNPEDTENQQVGSFEIQTLYPGVEIWRPKVTPPIAVNQCEEKDESSNDSLPVISNHTVDSTESPISESGNVMCQSGDATLNAEIDTPLSVSETAALSSIMSETGDKSNKVSETGTLEEGTVSSAASEVVVLSSTESEAGSVSNVASEAGALSSIVSKKSDTLNTVSATDILADTVSETDVISSEKDESPEESYEEYDEEQPEQTETEVYGCNGEHDVQFAKKDIDHQDTSSNYNDSGNTVQEKGDKRKDIDHIHSDIYDENITPGTYGEIQDRNTEIKETESECNGSIGEYNVFITEHYAKLSDFSEENSNEQYDPIKEHYDHIGEQYDENYDSSDEQYDTDNNSELLTDEHFHYEEGHNLVITDELADIDLSKFESNNTGVSSEGCFDTQNALISITLKKSATHGLGFSLVTAEKDNQTGVFVRSISVNGEADRDGRLQVMDRLVRVNDESLVGMTHTRAVRLIRKSKDVVTLTISRMSRRQLEVTTPPIIMTDSEEENYNVDESLYDETEGEDQNSEDEVELDDQGQKNHQCENSEKEGDGQESDEVQDKESDEDQDSDERSTDEEDMNALVREAERLLLDSGSVELNTDYLGEVVCSGSASFLIKSSDACNKDGDDTLSLSDGEGQLPMDMLEQKPANDTSRNKTFTIIASQRKLDVQVPEKLNMEWVNSLPLLIPTEDCKAYLPDLASILQQNISRNDPAEEYKELRNMKSTDDCEIAKLAENKSRNRFRNVLPYDINRVYLGSEEGYINASHILMNVGDCQAHYIASQGPMLETAEHFWQMIWEQNVSVIAMLTLDIENKKIKCHRYWPDSMETPIFVCSGTLRISLMSVESIPNVDVRKILLEDVVNGESNIVYHVNYTSWPDHGIPQPLPMLQCLQLVHAYHNAGPIVVHCSAGIGRTGAFITIDLALAQIENNGKCDIFEIVQELRRQRSGMIQTKDQYVLCYLTCTEAIQSLLHDTST